MMRIAYITAGTPFGVGEEFILSEMAELNRQGLDLLIVPRDISKEIVHETAADLVDKTLTVP